MSRIDDVRALYDRIGDLRIVLGGSQTLAAVRSWASLPQRGLYLFFEPGEIRTNSGDGPRLVRIGTHGLNSGSASTLVGRLKQHRGASAGGGNHRGSIFRLLVGQAMLARGDLTECPSWGVKSDAGKAAAALGLDRQAMSAMEVEVEQRVSQYIGAMPFLWLGVDDEPGPDSLRSVIERNIIALLSNFHRSPVDPPSPDWLGSRSDRPLVRGSGLWNQRHVQEEHDPALFDHLDRLIKETQR